MSTKYLLDVENAAAPGTACQDNYEELELVTFERQPSKVLGVATTVVGPPTATEGMFIVGQIWVDANRAVYICTAAGTPGTWRLDTPAPRTVAIAAADIDWDLGAEHTKTLGANTVFTFSHVADGKEIVVAITNTASNWTVTWPGTVKWPGGAAPVQTVGAKTDIYKFRSIGGVVYGRAFQNFF